MGEDFDKGRREFLKQSVLSVGKTVYEYYQQQKETLSETGPKESPVKVRTDWLRPPGAVAEELFLDRCTRCGDCLPACPYGSAHGGGGGQPGGLHGRPGVPVLPGEMPGRSTFD